ncbi:MAG: hypothetical protein ABI277_12150 [Burkholderiaceae bacterium]
MSSRLATRLAVAVQTSRTLPWTVSANATVLAFASAGTTHVDTETGSERSRRSRSRTCGT